VFIRRQRRAMQLAMFLIFAAILLQSTTAARPFIYTLF
jgi:hypothetical protein